MYDDGTTKFDSINIDSLGKIVSGILTVPDEFTNRYAFVSEFSLSQNDIFDALLKATKTDRKDWTVEHRTTADLRKDGLDKIGKGDFSGALDLIGAAVFQDGLGSGYSNIRKLDNALVGLEKGDLVAVTEKILQQQ